MRLAAGSQGVTPLGGNCDDALPTALLAIEDGVVLRTGQHQIVPTDQMAPDVEKEKPKSGNAYLVQFFPAGDQSAPPLFLLLTIEF